MYVASSKIFVHSAKVLVSTATKKTKVVTRSKARYFLCPCVPSLFLHAEGNFFPQKVQVISFHILYTFKLVTHVDSV